MSRLPKYVLVVGPLLFVAPLVSCREDPATAGSLTFSPSPDSGTASDALPIEGDAAVRKDASSFAGDGGAFACVEEVETQRWCEATRAVPGVVHTVLDLTNPNDLVTGRCDLWLKNGTFQLPDTLDAYPLLIKLSNTDFTGTCSCDDLLEPPTAYGVTFQVPPALLETAPQRLVSFRVAGGSWRHITGCVGEPGPCACLNAYLEYGAATCIMTYAGGFGVVTGTPNDAPGEVIVDLVDIEYNGACCPYRCQ